MADELKDQRIPIMMSPSEVKAIDDWMFANRIKSRAEAIRRLTQMGLGFDSKVGDLKLCFDRLKDSCEDFMSLNASKVEGNYTFDKYLNLLAQKTAAVFVSSEELGPVVSELLAIDHIYKTFKVDSDDYQIHSFEDVKRIFDELVAERREEQSKTRAEN